MISRAHGLALSLLLGAAVAAGAYAVTVTADIGHAKSKPEVVSARQIAQRTSKLDAWEASLAKTLEARPPALPALTRYPGVPIVGAPADGALPAPAPVATRAAQQAMPIVRATTPTKKRTPRGQHVAATEAPSRPVTDLRVNKPSEGNGAPLTPAPVSAPVAEPVSAPAPVVVPVSAPSPLPQQPAAQQVEQPLALSPEQQCRQLLRAAEGQSEQVKRQAEKQCEALKASSEHAGGDD